MLFVFLSPNSRRRMGHEPPLALFRLAGLGLALAALHVAGPAISRATRLPFITVCLLAGIGLQPLLGGPLLSQLQASSQPETAAPHLPPTPCSTDPLATLTPRACALSQPASNAALGIITIAAGSELVVANLRTQSRAIAAVTSSMAAATVVAVACAMAVFLAAYPDAFTSAAGTKDIRDGYGRSERQQHAGIGRPHGGEGGGGGGGGPGGVWVGGSDRGGAGPRLPGGQGGPRSSSLDVLRAERAHTTPPPPPQLLHGTGAKVASSSSSSHPSLRAPLPLRGPSPCPNVGHQRAVQEAATRAARALGRGWREAPRELASLRSRRLAAVAPEPQGSGGHRPAPPPPSSRGADRSRGRAGAAAKGRSCNGVPEAARCSSRRRSRAPPIGESTRTPASNHASPDPRLKPRGFRRGTPLP